MVGSNGGNEARPPDGGGCDWITSLPVVRTNPRAFEVVALCGLLLAQLFLFSRTIHTATNYDEDVYLAARITLCRSVQIGARTVVQPGAVIGGDGFGFASEQRRWIKVPQVGTVRVGPDVEIGANTTIDRGAVDGVRRQKGFDRFHMTAGDHGVGQRQAARPRIAVLEQGRVRGRAAQQRPIRLGIGKESAAAKRDDLLPVGLNDRDIDAIHRGAAHQAYRADRSNWFSPPGHRQRPFLAYLQIAFNARHSPNESKGSPDGVLSAASRIAMRSAVIGCEAKIAKG